MGRAKCPCARTCPPFRQKVRVSVRRVDGSSSLVHCVRGRGIQACRRQVAAPGIAAVDPGSAPIGLCIVAGSFRCPAESVADRIISMGRMASGREILFCPTARYREHRVPVGFRRPAEAHSGPAFRPLDGVECVRSISFLWLLSGGRVPRDSAVRTGSPMGRVYRHFARQCPLHFWAAPLELLFGARLGRGPDVRVDLRDRSFFWHSVQEIRQSLDCGGHPRHR